MVLVVRLPAGDGHGVEERGVVAERAPVVGQPLVAGVDRLVGHEEVEGDPRLQVLQGHAQRGDAQVVVRVGHGGAERLPLGAVRGPGHHGLAGQLGAGGHVEAELTAGGLLVRVHQPLDVVERAGQAAGVLRAHGHLEGGLARLGVGPAGDDLESGAGRGRHAVVADDGPERQERPLGVRALGAEALAEVVVPARALRLVVLVASRGGGGHGGGDGEGGHGGRGQDRGTAAYGHVGSFSESSGGWIGGVRGRRSVPAQARSARRVETTNRRTWSEAPCPNRRLLSRLASSTKLCGWGAPVVGS